MIQPRQVLTLAFKEFRDRLRNRWVLITKIGRASCRERV